MDSKPTSTMYVRVCPKRGLSPRESNLPLNNSSLAEQIPSGDNCLSDSPSLRDLEYKFSWIIMWEDLFWNRGTAQKRRIDQIAPNFAWITLWVKHFGVSGQIFHFRPPARMVGGDEGGGWGWKIWKKFFSIFLFFSTGIVRRVSLESKKSFKSVMKRIYARKNCQVL